MREMIFNSRTPSLRVLQVFERNSFIFRLTRHRTGPVRNAFDAPEMRFLAFVFTGSMRGVFPP